MARIVGPTPTQIMRGLVSAIVADATAGGSLLQNTLVPYGVALDAVTRSKHNATAYKQIKIGDRMTMPNGLSVFVVQSTSQTRWFASPDLAEKRHSFFVLGYWSDYNDPSSTEGMELTADPDSLHPMMSDFGQALEAVLSPKNLGTDAGGFWLVPGTDGGMVGDPMVSQVVPYGQVEIEKHQNLVSYTLLAWSCVKYVADP